MNTATATSLREAAELIRAAPSLACVGHVAPDADALGSALALASAARHAGKEAVVSFGEPFTVPPSFDFLPQEGLVAPADFPDEAHVVVAFDTAAPDRLGSLRPKIRAAKHLIVVDHHESNDGFGDIQVIDPGAGAAGQLAYHLIKEIGWEITPDTATALLGAIVADTGRFQYSSTTPETLRIAADLIESGARFVDVGQHLFEMAPVGYLDLAATVMQRAELDEERQFIWSAMYRSDLAEAGVGYEDADALIDQIRVVREADVALLLKEVDGGFKASMRSRGRVDVGAIAVELGGGGHHNAAGFEFVGTVEEAVAAVRSRLDG